MRASFKTACALVLPLLISACVTSNSISISQIPQVAERQNLISAKSSRPIIFLIPFGTSYVEEAQAELLAQCAGGRIEGVLANEVVKDYFVGLVVLKQLELQGYCLKSVGKGKKS